MNLLISEAIKRKTNAVLKYSTDANGVTIYHVTKNVGGHPHTVRVEVTAAFSAANNADAIASHVAVEASKHLQSLREFSRGVEADLKAEKDAKNVGTKPKADAKQPVATGTTSEATGTTEPAKVAGGAGDEGCEGCTR